ncbi:hypothetical protein QCA50_011357 [Cerrena zonata]|uniref:Uncharacterized protein n=1 Tax=Cerrena zonata TaxID=2478898 RepID=A0AAW0FVB2_9APHY
MQRHIHYPEALEPFMAETAAEQAMNVSPPAYGDLTLSPNVDDSGEVVDLGYQYTPWTTEAKVQQTPVLHPSLVNVTFEWDMHLDPFEDSNSISLALAEKPFVTPIPESVQVYIGGWNFSPDGTTIGDLLRGLHDCVMKPLTPTECAAFPQQAKHTPTLRLDQLGDSRFRGFEIVNYLDDELYLTLLTESSVPSQAN